MTSSLAHRGPDDSGIWLDADISIALGHRRLSIIDLSPLGHQPMISASGRYVLTFNGEIYNYEEIRKEQTSYPFRGKSDTEVMLAAFETWGIQRALESFNGMFAFALWDREERILHLACDRFGEKPLYYGFSGGVLIFGSELKALTAYPGFDNPVHQGALSLFLSHGYIPGPHSIYAGINKVEPGTSIGFTWDRLNTGGERRAFWSARDVAVRAQHQAFRGTVTDAVDRLEELLASSVRMRMVADVPLGAFLSGGIDSTMIVALMQKYGSRQAKTFTIGFREKSHDEADEARMIAKRLGTDHTELYVTPTEAMSVIPKLGTIYDEPFADPSQVPTYLVSALARQHVTVSLSGDGGDEFFGGYARFLWSRQIWGKLRYCPRFLRTLLARSVTMIPPDSWDRLARFVPDGAKGNTPGRRVHKLASLLDSSTPEELYLRFITEKRGPETLAAVPPKLAVKMADSDCWAPLSTYLGRMMLIDTIGYLPDDILVKVDRAAMAVSLETRTPYLDPRIFEFAWSLPDEWKIRQGRGKWLLREVLYRYVPREMMDRPKSGFAVPIDTWLRGPLRDWAESLLDERLLRRQGFFNSASIRGRWAQHLSGTHNYYSYLWSVLMFQSWLGSASPPAPLSGALPHIVSSEAL